MKKSILMIGLLQIALFSCAKEATDIYHKNKGVATSVPQGEKITLKSGAVVERINGDIVYLGDILLSDEEYKRLDETGSMFRDGDYSDFHKDEGTPIYPLTGMSAYQRSSSRAVGVHPYQNRFWTMLRFRFSSELKSWQIQNIKKAIAYMESVTNVRFFDATNEPTVDPFYGFPYPYVEFTPSNVNNSYVGRKGGKQEINLYNYDQGTIVHEICHALGMFHEQCRANRDDYIKVHYENIDPQHRHNFNKEMRNYYMIGSFDFNSIMIYDSYAFSNNNKPTMTKIDGSTFSGHFQALSEEDRMFLNRHYLPYKIRKDICIELDDVVYNSNNIPLSEKERIDLEQQLNIGRCNHPIPK